MAGIQKAEKVGRAVRIFLAAPARDTQALREVIEAEIERIRSSRLTQRLMRVELIRWDDETRPIPMSWLRPPQEAVNDFTGGPSSCDLVIGVFRHVFGSELDEARFGARSDGKRWACTEWELHTAAKAAREGLVGDVLIFQDMASLTRRGKTPAQYEADAAELKRVTEFIAQARQDGCANRGVHEFEGEEELAQVFPGLLDSWLDDYLSKVKIDRPAKLGHSAGMLPTFDLRPYLTRRRDHWRSTDAGQLDRRFVNLSLMIDHGLAHDGPRHTQEARFDRLGDLLAKRPDVGAWVLVGDPGGGKSTILQHHEMTAAAAALADDAGAMPELCVWQRLSTYSHDSPLPAEWLAQHWPADLPALAVLRGVARVRFLLDGLNEIKAPDRARQLDAIDRWTEWAARLAHQGDHLLAPIFSVRTLDQSPLSTGDFEVRQIVVGRWSEAQIRLYCQQMLGDQGETLWLAIKGKDKDDRHLLELSTLPFNLRAQCELFGALGDVVRDRARLMGGLFWLRLRNQARTGPLKVPGLIGEDDVLALSGDRWKEKLTELPEEGCLVPWLDDRAQGLQRLGRQVSVSKQDLLKDLPAHDPCCKPADWLKAAGALQLIDEGSGDQKALRRFSHQLWQEFFAARGLRDLPTCAPDRLPDLRPPALVPLEEVLAKLGVQEPLPGPDPSHWEEPVTLAVQLVRDPLPWVRALEPVNLPLAGRAAVACQEKAEALHGAAVFDGLRQALLTRSRDAKVDVRLRIEAGLVLGDLGDPRYERRSGSHDDFLWPKPEHWISIPGGDYTIGRDGSGDEGPETPVRLESFEMAFAPVTNAEFQCFVDAGGYDPKASWWESEAAQAWLAGGNDGLDGSIRQYLEVLEQIRALPAVLFDALPESYRQQVQRHLPMSDVEIAAEFQRERSEQPRDRPAFSLDMRINRASQPVVGVCLFEARAYVAWLSSQCGEEVCLPTEAEWEVAAASGAARRRWPHGDSEPDFDQVNHDQTHLWRTSPVGVFPRGDTLPDTGGLTDMAGNVWEWTSSAYTERYDPVSPITACQDDSALRVVRGGAWNSPTVNCRASCRRVGDPDARYGDLGLRLVRRRVPHSEP